MFMSSFSGEAGLSTPVLEKCQQIFYEPNWLGYPYHIASGFPGPACTDYSNAFRGRRSFRRFSFTPGTSRGNRFIMQILSNNIT